MKIGIDLDNILNNMNHEWINKYNYLNNDNLTIEDIKCWDIHKYVKCGHHIYTYLDDDLFNRLQPLPNAVEVTQWLQRKGHELFVVTATHPNNVRVKMEWLKHHFPHISMDNVIICHRKDLIDVELLIDDAAHNIESFKGYAMVMDQAWNRSLGVSPGVGKFRVYDWLHIKQYFEQQG